LVSNPGLSFRLGENYVVEFASIAKEKKMPDKKTSELRQLKDRLKATWMAGDFGRIAKYVEAAAEEFVARRCLQPGAQVLDVACGSGNVAVPAAQAGAIVTGVDIAPNLLEQAGERAISAGVKIQLDEGDAEELPYPDSWFDVVVSMFGAMFALRPDRVAAELVRVCRPGGQIAMANWTPDGFIGQMFKATTKHLPPPSGAPVPPVMWGDADIVRERLRDGVSHLVVTPLMAQLRLPLSVPETVEFFRTYYGPTQKAFAALSEDKQLALRRDMEDLFAQYNKATDGTTAVEAEYLEVVATRA
jgi:ubiquinone/menaquinone biosynthesis C-methylase UbiE